jgi:DNA helicase-2/ATP-dependent DNA helicase PcrA
VIANPKDELSLRRILNIPHRGIGTQSLKKYLERSAIEGIPLYQVIEKVAQEEENKRGEALKEFVAIIHKYRSNFETMTLTQALGALINEIDYFSFISRSYDSPKIAARKKDDVRNFLLSTDRFVDRFAEEANLQNYLERLLLVDNQDNQNNEEGVPKNEVQLMTLHSSKGLEFGTCYIIGMEEELLPHKNVIQGGGDIDEERRLAYVGITRAKERLVMTYARERKIYGKYLKRHLSRFVTGHDDHFESLDRDNFSHMTEDEIEEHKSNFFNDLLQSLED